MLEYDIADDFYAFSAKGLANAYSDDEPEYDSSMVKEPNPLYIKWKRGEIVLVDMVPLDVTFKVGPALILKTLPA